jgi:2-keto-3-deoxy-L-fuconate dehydrogenase
MDTLFSLKNKTAVVTGGGSGIGKAIAELFARQGANTIILDVDETGAHASVKTIQDAGGRAEMFYCDVTDQGSVNTAVQSIVAKAGRIDILANSAGISHIGNLVTTSESDFDKVFRVNVQGVFTIMKAVVTQMKASGGGVIVNLASIAADAGIADRFAYSMSKGAVRSMTLSVARDFIKDNIRCNCISPARVHTPFVDDFLKKNYAGREQEMFEKLSKAQPIGRMGKPDEVAALALYLCSDQAAFVTGCDYPIDGGFMKLMG